MKFKFKSEKNGGTSSEGKGKSPVNLKFLYQFLGGREIDKRVNEDFPSWDEFSNKKLQDALHHKGKPVVELPPHRIYVSSPLQWNFLYVLVVLGMLAMGYAQPDWGPFFVYGAILFIFMVALFVIGRDAIFYHIEGQRLEEDCEMINRHSEGPEMDEDDDDSSGFLKTFSRKKKNIFVSKLFQIHYQNVLRTFEQGNRRTWVNQESSINDLHTLLTQRGMKLVWTLIEVLPQFGLLGTLIGLARMFMAFTADATLPEVSILAGFGTALGTTILANLFVLILRPLYMRNERAMNEILSTLQMLMATFILPTQQYVLDRRSGFGGTGLPAVEQLRPAAAPGSGKLARSMEALTGALAQFNQHNSEQGESHKDATPTDVASELTETLKAFQENIEPANLDAHNQALVRLGKSMEKLGDKLEKATGKGDGKLLEKLEHDLMQVRLLNHDTLILLEKIASRLDGDHPAGKSMLSKNPSLRTSVFPDQSETERAGRTGKGKPKSGLSGMG